MDASLTIGSSFLSPKPTVNPSTLNHHFLISIPHKPSVPCRSSTIVRASYNPSPHNNNFVHHKLKTTAAAIVFAAAAAASVVGKFQQLPARAESLPAQTEEIEKTTEEEAPGNSPLSRFLESNSDAIEGLKTLLQQKLEAGEDEESLEILKKLVSSQPGNSEWKFLMARLLSEMGETQEAREVFEEILENNPLSFEALFENALLMDRSGEGEAVIERLEKALRVAETENKMKEMRDVKLIMAQVQFLQKNVEEALKSYEELIREDPKDFRPYFCKGMIFSLLDRNKEAKDQFAKYRELSPKKFEVEGYIRTPLSKMKLFGTEEEN